jgi:uncharacterized RDD family membrane protein YckC
VARRELQCCVFGLSCWSRHLYSTSLEVSEELTEADRGYRSRLREAVIIRAEEDEIVREVPAGTAGEMYEACCQIALERLRYNAVVQPDGNDQVLGRRMLAAFVDILLLGIVFVLVGIITGGAHSSSNSASVTLGAGGTAVFVLIAGVYYFGCESTTGQTVGKRLLGIRVKGEDGTAATTRGVAIRTVLRIIDALSLFYLVGFVAMMATGARRQRLGDLAGHTFVTR